MRSPDGWKPRSVVVALLALALLAPAASEAATKQYTLSLDGSPPAVAGSTVTFLATFTNPADQQQQLGSANLTPPAGFGLVSASVPGPATATISGGTVELRNLSLQPGAPPLTVSVTATVPCDAAAPATWSVLAKQNNNFNGPPGNDLTLAPGSSLTTPVTGSCALALRFVTEPAGAEVGAVITGTPWNQAGPPVAVEVVDGAGARVTNWAEPVVLSTALGSALGTLSGASAPTVSGLAEFPALRIDARGFYRLTATSGSLSTAEPSGQFRIGEEGTPCVEDVPCSAQASTGRSKLTVTGLPNGSPDAGLLTLTFDAGLAIDCADYTELTFGTAVFEVTGNREKIASLRVDKRDMAALPNNGAAFIELCMGAPEPFTTKSGAQSGEAGEFDWDGNGALTPVYRGLLPDCGVVAPPCVSKRLKVGAGDGLIEALLPPGDPAMRG
jgi:hypothetical protein